MKTKITILLLLFSALLLRAQTPKLDWAVPVSGNLSVEGYAIAIDKAGNLYTTGRFIDSLYLTPEKKNALVSRGGFSDAYVLKLNPQGKLLWAKQFTGPDKDEAYALATDSACNVYVTGAFMDSLDMDPGKTTHKVFSHGNYDIFVIKLDSSGRFIWGKTVGGSGIDQPSALAVDKDKNVYVTGFFEDSVDFNPDQNTALCTARGLTDDFILKLNPEGHFIWAKTFGGKKEDSPRAIAVDAQGNVVTAGGFFGSADFHPGKDSAVFISRGDEDLFIQKLDSAGNFVWAKTIGGTGYDRANALFINNSSGDIYMAGTFSDTVDFAPHGGHDTLISISGGGDGFVEKLHADGGFVFARSTTAQTGFVNIRTIKADHKGNIFSAGEFAGKVDFDPGNRTFFVSSPVESFGEDFFVWELNDKGNFTWVGDMHPVSSELKTAGKNKSMRLLITIRSLAVDASDNLYTTGQFWGVYDFDPSENNFLLKSQGSDNAFIQKFSQKTTGIIQPHLEGIQIYPNPSTGKFYIDLGNMADATVTVTDGAGRTVKVMKHCPPGKMPVRLKSSAGIYFIQVIWKGQTGVYPLLLK